MNYNFIPCNRDQLLLLPPDLREWLPNNHLVWFILDVISQMDISIFYQGYRPDGTGHAAYEPSMMVSLLIYAYCLGQRSSRKIERLCEQDVAFRVITANLKPDHATIARFRRENGPAVEKLFVEVLRLCQKAKLLKLGVVALDGTKIKGNTSLAANRTLEALEEEVKKILKEAEEADALEDAQYGKNRRGDELPPELADRKSRLARLKECKERLEREAEEAKADQQKKINEREKKAAETGQKNRGPKPKPLEKAVDDQAKANVTDPDSRIMKTSSGYTQGYNAQAVATEDQIIISAEVTQQANDVKQLQPMIENVAQTLAQVGINETVGALACDAGYFSGDNLEQQGKESPELFVATKKDWKQRRDLKQEPAPCGRIPHGLNRRQKMERKLRTIKGRAVYAKRKFIIEPIFGQIKDARGIRHFLMRGLEHVSTEWKLICATHNLLKLFRKGNLQLA